MESLTLPDLGLAYNRQRRQPVLDRINQYGVAPITIQNLLNEWMAKTEDNNRRKDLEALWEQQRTNDQTSTFAARIGLL